MIKVTVTAAYGNITIAPTNEDAARLLFITGRRYLKVSDLHHARAMGIEVLIYGEDRFVRFVEMKIERDEALWRDHTNIPSLEYSTTPRTTPRRIEGDPDPELSQ
jgi:hypothetical protein